MRVLLETHDSHRGGADVARVLGLVRASARAAPCGTSCTPGWAGEQPSATFPVLAPYLGYVQVKDIASAEDTAPLPLGRRGAAAAQRTVEVLSPGRLGRLAVLGVREAVVSTQAAELPAQQWGGAGASGAAADRVGGLIRRRRAAGGPATGRSEESGVKEGSSRWIWGRLKALHAVHVHGSIEHRGRPPSAPHALGGVAADLQAGAGDAQRYSGAPGAAGWRSPTPRHLLRSSTAEQLLSIVERAEVALEEAAGQASGRLTVDGRS